MIKVGNLEGVSIISPIAAEDNYENSVYGKSIYIGKYGVVPNMLKISGDNFDSKKFLNQILEEKSDSIKKLNEIRAMGSVKKEVPGLRSLLLENEKEKILIAYESGRYDSGVIKIYHQAFDEPEGLLSYLIGTSRKSISPPKPKKKRKVGRIYTLSVIGTGMTARVGFKKFDLKQREVKIEENYNDDFKEIHETVVEKLNEKDGTGVVILHGKPGTGKSHYLRHLCKVLKKKILFIPPAMIHHIMEPSFMALLSRHKNSIMVLEDGDTLVRERIGSTNEAASTLLNMTDGMLADILGIQVVLTFNIDVKDVDEAFLRNGRCIAEYEFKELAAKKAQALSKKLGFDSKIDKPMLLTDVFNQENKALRSEKGSKVIGYKS